MDFDVLAFIGRFQMPHEGHGAVIDTALTRAKKVALVMGSHLLPRGARNPWTTAERIAMITSVYPDEVESGRIQFVPQVDHMYNMDRWISGIQAGVSQVANTPFTPDPVRIGLIGHSKDHSSFYLKSFPIWDSVSVASFQGLNATDLRDAYFSDGTIPTVGVAPSVAAFLRDFKQTQAYRDVKAEHDFLVEYKKQFQRPSDASIDTWLMGHNMTNDAKDSVKAFADKFCPQYPPVFYTADSVVIQSGHVLLVKRGAMPGKGLWALPGGFVNRYENSFDAAIRELREETRIDVPEAVLRGSKRMWSEFSDPYRSQRGRTVTNAFLFELRQTDTLPKIKGSDDAEKARWVPLGNLDRKAMFEDHYDIIEKMVGI